MPGTTVKPITVAEFLQLDLAADDERRALVNAIGFDVEDAATVAVRGRTAGLLPAAVSECALPPTSTVYVAVTDSGFSSTPMLMRAAWYGSL